MFQGVKKVAVVLWPPLPVRSVFRGLMLIQLKYLWVIRLTGHWRSAGYD